MSTLPVARTSNNWISKSSAKTDRQAVNRGFSAALKQDLTAFSLFSCAMSVNGKHTGKEVVEQLQDPENNWAAGKK